MKDYEYNSIFLPYALQKVEDDMGGWVILNRKYKFLGTTTWSYYTLAPKIFRLYSGVNDGLRHYLSMGFEDPLYEDKMYFFDGTCSPLSKNAFKKDRELYVAKLSMISGAKTIDGLDVYYLLLPAIERVNKWDVEGKIVGPGHTQKRI
jgi:hypothetical protein